jgi:hypothetical protein
MLKFMDLFEKLDKKVDKKLFEELDLAREVVDNILGKIAAQRLAQIRSEPKCPECNAGVIRPKCLFELGGDCPRHDVINYLGGRSKIIAHLDSLKERRKRKPLDV